MKERARQVVTANVAEAKATLQQLLELEGQVEAASAIIAEALLSGHKLLACGNGGSAADASHLTTEFVVRYDRERRAYPAISLGSNGGDLTAIGNDYSFADLVREKRVMWSGVANAAALKNMRAMQKGDDVLLYHTGKEKAVVGTGKVLRAAYVEPDPQGAFYRQLARRYGAPDQAPPDAADRVILYIRPTTTSHQ